MASLRNPLLPQEGQEQRWLAHSDPSAHTPPPAPQQGWLMAVVAFQSLLLLGLALATVPGPTFWQRTTHSVGFDSPVYMSECMHPLGGGQVQLGGGFKPLNDTVVSDECATELEEYFSKQEGQYWVDVARVAEAAREYFDTLSASEPPTARKLIIFDIDETTLSNAEEWQGVLQRRLRSRGAAGQQQRRGRQGQRQGQQGQEQQGHGQGQGRQQRVRERQQHHGVGDSAGMLAAGGVDGEAGFGLWKAAPGLSERPPLAPMLALYQYLFASGYSVAFITGRKESQRNSTAVNLLAAGYGRPCKKERLQEHLSQDEGRRQEGQAGGRQRRPTAACYAALHLRDYDDDRFASVYKPSRRQALLDEGFTIYGNFGDQFSDLDGEHGAPHSFKLPNPAYYIL